MPQLRESPCRNKGAYAFEQTFFNGSGAAAPLLDPYCWGSRGSMSIAYVTEQNASINREGERFLIKKQGTVLHTLHAFKLEQMVLFGNVSLTPSALAYLLHLGVDTVFMTRDGRYRGRLQPPHSKNITLRCDQFRRLSDPQFCLEASRSIVEGKIVNLRTVLLRLNRSRSGLAMEDHILSLKLLAQKAAEAQDMNTLRGYEGRAAVLFFDGFSKGFLADGIEFKRRERRPPKDPVNALLSLGYTLLFNAVMAAVSLVGLDPYLGCLHTLEYGRPSLALDLMEEWRPILIDTLVLSVFNLKTITLDDFMQGQVKAEALEDEGDGVFLDDVEVKTADVDSSTALPVKLTDAGFRKFLAQFERKMAEKVQYPFTGQGLSYRDCIREQVRRMARYIRNEELTYKPMLLR